MAHHGDTSDTLRQLLADQQRDMMKDLAGGDEKSAQDLERMMRDRNADHARIREQLAAKTGATGRFPEGKLVEEDKGEIAVMVAVVKGRVVVHFGDKPVTWLAMTAEQAEGFAGALLERAEKIRALGGS